MFTLIKKINPFLSLIAIIYLILGLLTLHNVYFWDVIQQVSKEGYWFYKTDFSSLFIPSNNEFGIWATGYHPPLTGMMTAVLWKFFGYELWVSHAFSMCWAVLLIYNTWKIAAYIYPPKHIGWVTLILLLEPPILTQFAIASPDFILFTAFVISLRSIIERKQWLLAISLLFLCGVNMRGVFVGCALFTSNLFFYHWKDKNSWRQTFGKTILPYLPAFLLLASYFIYFFVQKGWFFEDSPYAEHYSMPHDVKSIIVHFLSFGLRSIENGRIIIWLLALYFGYRYIRQKKEYKLTDIEKMLLLFFILLHGLYFVFVFVTQMPFSPRYFIPQFFALNMLVALLAIRAFSSGQLKVTYLTVGLFFITGHFWIYPERVAKLWDATLAHLPFYELRKECLDFVENNEDFDYREVEGDWIYTDRGFMEMNEEYIRPDFEQGEKDYFIYSNILNVPDDFFDELQNPIQWMPIQTFKKWPVIFTVYKKTATVNLSDNE